MVESFTLGMLTAFLLRCGVMRTLRWPYLSSKFMIKLVPLKIVPEMLVGGTLFSFLDLMRRIALDASLKKE